MGDWDDLQRLAATLQRLGVNTQTPPRLPTREEIIDAAIANLAIDRTGMTDGDRKRLKEELLNGE